MEHFDAVFKLDLTEKATQLQEEEAIASFLPHLPFLLAYMVTLQHYDAQNQRLYRPEPNISAQNAATHKFMASRFDI